MSGDPLSLYDYRPGDGDNLILQKILRAAAALPAAIAAAGIPEAPIDGQPYARMNAGWVVAAGGVSVIAGVVDVHADLPVTVGSPVVNSAYLVRDSSGTWLPFYDSRKPGGIWIRQFNLGNLDDWVYAGELQATQNAANFTVYDPTAPTKEMGFNPASVTAGARRILTPLDKNYTIEETGHKAKHENGGSDEISVAGLSGVLADPQPPIIGALATQAVAGNDARLADARTPTAHKTSHENGGTDEISVAGLSGVLADPQPPIIGAGGTQAVAGNDARLTDERVPTAAGLTSKFSTNKGTLVDGDKVAILDSEAADAPKHGLWSLVKSTLKAYFDTIYQAAGSYLTSGGALGTPLSGTLTNCTGLPVAGAVMATARILGRTTAGSGAVEEITVGSGLSLSAGSLTATGGGGTDIFDFTQLDAVATFGGSTLACNVPYRASAVGSGTLTTYAGSDFPAAEIRTGTTSGWGHYVAFWASSGTSNTFDLDETHTWTMMFHIRTGADIGNYRLLVGAVGTAGAAVPVAGIGVRFDTDASDTNFRLAAWDASTPTLGSDNLGAVAINTVYAIKIWCTGDGTVRATVNGGTQSTLTTGFTATRVTPLFQLINSTTADKRMQCARFAFHVEGLSP